MPKSPIIQNWEIVEIFNKPILHGELNGSPFYASVLAQWRHSIPTDKGKFRLGKPSPTNRWHIVEEE